MVIRVIYVTKFFTHFGTLMELQLDNTNHSDQNKRFHASDGIKSREIELKKVFSRDHILVKSGEEEKWNFCDNLKCLSSNQ